MRVQIKPALHRVWRGPSTVQIGLDPRYGTVLDGLTPADRSLVDRLAEGVDPVDELRGRADERRELEVVRLLTDAGVLVRSRAGRAALARLGAARSRLAPDAAVWSVVHGAQGGDGWELLAARAQRRVDVVGGGRTGWALASTLATAGVGKVAVTDGREVGAHDVAPAAARPEHVGLQRGPTATQVAAQFATGSAACAAITRPADLVVLVESGVADAAHGQRLLGGDVAHLSVVVREGSLVVGPLVVPGTAPCLRCLDLHRADRDPAWPRMLAQVLAARRSAPAAPDAAQETASSQLAASLAALQVLAFLDGAVLPDPPAPASLGATLEVELPDGLVSRRPWPGHPACGCSWPPRGPVQDGPVQDGREVLAPATMDL